MRSRPRFQIQKPPMAMVSECHQHRKSLPANQKTKHWGLLLGDLVPQVSPSLQNSETDLKSLHSTDLTATLASQGFPSKISWLFKKRPNSSRPFSDSSLRHPPVSGPHWARSAASPVPIGRMSPCPWPGPGRRPCWAVSSHISFQWSFVTPFFPRE